MQSTALQGAQAASLLEITRNSITRMRTEKPSVHVHPERTLQLDVRAPERLLLQRSICACCTTRSQRVAPRVYVRAGNTRGGSHG